MSQEIFDFEKQSTKEKKLLESVSKLIKRKGRTQTYHETFATQLHGTKMKFCISLVILRSQMRGGLLT